MPGGPCWARRTRRWCAALAFALAELVLRHRRGPLCLGSGRGDYRVAAALRSRSCCRQLPRIACSDTAGIWPPGPAANIRVDDAQVNPPTRPSTNKPRHRPQPPATGNTTTTPPTGALRGVTH
jgi:hypothetical protein